MSSVPLAPSVHLEWMSGSRGRRPFFFFWEALREEDRETCLSQIEAVRVARQPEEEAMVEFDAVARR